MIARNPGPYDNVQFLDEAVEDRRLLAERSRPVLFEVLRRLKRLDSGEESPQELHDYAKTGDVRDCGKIVVALEDESEYRIVVRDLGGHVQVSVVVAVEDREQDLPYLLAGLRLGRITDQIRRSDLQWRIQRIRNRRVGDFRPARDVASQFDPRDEEVLVSREYRVALQARGTLALPAELRKRHHLDEPGAQVRVVERDDGVIELHPLAAVPADQQWFWSERWQEREREVDERLGAGRVKTYNDIDEFLESLDE